MGIFQASERSAIIQQENPPLQCKHLFSHNGNSLTEESPIRATSGHCELGHHLLSESGTAFHDVDKTYRGKGRSRFDHDRSSSSVCSAESNALPLRFIEFRDESIAESVSEIYPHHSASNYGIDRRSGSDAPRTLFKRS